MTTEEYLELKREEERFRREADRARGAIDQLRVWLKDEFGVATEAEGHALQKKLKKELAVLEQEADTVSETLTEERRCLDRLLAEHRLARMNVRREKEALTAAEQRAADVGAARLLVQEIAEQVQNDAVGKIASVVTHCLQSVFAENAYEFRINFVKSRGKTEARFQLVRGDLVLEEPLTEAGGGVCDLVAFALRLACLMLSVPRRRKVLVMDEPFKGLHGEANRQRAADLIEALAEEMGVQFIIATGLDWLRVGKVVEVEKES